MFEGDLGTSGAYTELCEKVWRLPIPRLHIAFDDLGLVSEARAPYLFKGLSVS